MESMQADLLQMNTKVINLASGYSALCIVVSHVALTQNALYL